MAHNKDKTLIAVKKASSVLNKIEIMIQEDKYCIDVIQQVLAVIGLLRSANEHLLEGHLNHCFKNAMDSKDRKRQNEMIIELTKVMKMAQKK